MPAKKTEKKPARKAVKVVKKKAPAKKATVKKAKAEVSNDEVLHVLIPKHEKVSETERKAVFEKYHVSIKQMPRIALTDPAIRHLSLKDGDIIKISRTSLTSGDSTFYRCVVSE